MFFPFKPGDVPVFFAEFNANEVNLFTGIFFVVFFECNLSAYYLKKDPGPGNLAKYIASVYAIVIIRIPNTLRCSSIKKNRHVSVGIWLVPSNHPNLPWTSKPKAEEVTVDNGTISEPSPS